MEEDNLTSKCKRRPGEEQYFEGFCSAVHPAIYFLKKIVLFLFGGGRDFMFKEKSLGHLVENITLRLKSCHFLDFVFI